MHCSKVSCLLFEFNGFMNLLHFIHIYVEFDVIVQVFASNSIDKLNVSFYR